MGDGNELVRDWRIIWGVNRIFRFFDFFVIFRFRKNIRKLKFFGKELGRFFGWIWFRG